MADDPTVDSPDAAAALGQLLYEFSPDSRNVGARLHRAGSVTELTRADDSTVIATVSNGVRGRRVVLRRADDGWTARCSCPRNEGCEHVFAVSLAWMARLAQGSGSSGATGVDETTAAALAASLNPPRRLSFRQRWEPVLAEKLGRPLAPEEGAFLGKLSNLFHNFTHSRRINAYDILRLGFQTHQSRQPPYSDAYPGWWDTPPRDPLELWQYIAHDIESSGLAVPQFMQPLTDTKAIRERMKDIGRRDAVRRWRDRLQHLGGGAAAAPEPAGESIPEPLQLRLLLGSGQWTLETRPTAEAPWKTAPRHFLERFARNTPGTLAEVDASPAVLAFLALVQDHYRHTYYVSLSAEQPTARALLRKLLLHRLARTLILDAGGRPVTFATERVRWRLSRAHDSERDYELALELPDGSPLPPSAVLLPGQPDLYLHDGTVYPGPPALDRNTAAGAVVPLEAIESPDVLTMLRRFGTRLPPEIEARFVTVALRPRITCELEVDESGHEFLALLLHAVANEPPAERHWTPAGWMGLEDVAAPAADQDNKIAVHDFSAADGAAAKLAALKLGFDGRSERWMRRVTKSFPEEFLAWRESLGPDVEFVAHGELASLLAAPVRAQVDFELVESAAHRDWFDLALALKPEDTTLTKEEIALLLKARGKLVRLPGKGWRRLSVELDDHSASALEAAGFERGAIADAALAGERHRLHALQLAQSAIAELLPERQATALRARARELTVPAPPALPRALRAELRPYQKDGFHFLAFLAANGLGGVLADDMGLGKTVQTLAWLLWLAETRREQQPRAGGLRVLVVCPKSVVGNWENETAKFAPSLETERFTRQAAPSTGAVGKTSELGLLVLANYTQLRLAADYFTTQKWDVVILDEGQFIKTPTSKVAQVARELPAEHRLILTGTPIENRLLDLWSLFAFALPGLLGSQAAFKRHYAQENPLALPRLRARVRHFLLRRTKAQVAADLPPRTEEDVVVELEGEQAKLYQAELKRARAELLKVNTTREFDRARFNILSSLLRLRQICCHPALIDPAHHDAPAAKLEELLERVEELRDEGHQVLVFSQFVSMLEIIRGKLAAAGIGHLMLTGQTENRDELVAEFQADKRHTVFLLSLKAAGFGLNLTAASYVILYDPWWNPAVEAQAIDRTHRIGQAVPVIAYRLIARGTVEEKIRALQREKAVLAGAIVQEESLASVLDLDSLREILA